MGVDWAVLAVAGLCLVIIYGVNLLIYGGFYVLSRRLARRFRNGPRTILRSLSARPFLLFLVVISPLVILPGLLNIQSLGHVAALRWSDAAPAPLTHRNGRLALLIEPPQATDRPASLCDKPLCEALLRGGGWGEVLAGLPPELGASLDPNEDVTAFSLRRRVKCAPQTAQPAPKGPYILMTVPGPATGPAGLLCYPDGPPEIVSRKDRLGVADLVVTLQAIPGWPGHSGCVYPGLLPIGHEAVLPAREHWCDPSLLTPVIGTRLTLWRWADSGAAMLGQKTALGASFWLMPMLLGPADPRILSELILAGPEFARIDIGVGSRFLGGDREPEIDVAAQLAAWGVLARPLP